MARPRLPSHERRQWIFVLGFVAILGLGIAALFVVQGGGGAFRRYLPKIEGDPAAVARLLEESQDLEAQFRARTFVTAPTDADVAPLQEAIRLQSEYMKATRLNDATNLARLDALESLLAEARGRGLQEASLRAESVANERLEAGETAEALAALREAYDLQRTLNSGKARALRDTGREATLAKRIQTMEALPLAEQSRQAEAEARTYVRQEKWTEALEAFGRARDLQVEVNTRFPNATGANIGRVEDLEIEIASFSTGGLIQEIQGLLDRAEAATLGGNPGEAAIYYREALKKQLVINTDYPKSRFASREKLEEIRITIETVESFPLADRIRGLDQAIRSQLADRTVELARQSIEQAGAALEEFARSFRRSTLVTEEQRTRLAFLREVQGNLASVQDAVYPNLLALPGTGDRLMMLQTEVPQGLYVRVMGNNPSRNTGVDLLPVESVSWEEAQTFCQRLGWMLGRPVRLPTLEEFRKAAGEADRDTLPQYAWIVETAEGVTRAVASSNRHPAGFFDLYGNVAEWLDAPPAAGQVTFAGGSYTDRASAFRTLPTGNRTPNERSRTIGFRFVVDLADPAAATALEIPRRSP